MREGGAIQKNMHALYYYCFGFTTKHPVFGVFGFWLMENDFNER